VIPGIDLNTIVANPPAGSVPEAAPKPWQPRGLAVIFFTEMWERFSFYGMRGILVLYLVKQLGYKDTDANEVLGIYAGLVYVTPMIGGWIADRWLGMRLAAVIGGAVMMLGHFAMAVPSMLHVALGLLIVGNGFFKANTSSMVGELYDGANDPRRDGGYSIFYMGINLGAMLAPLVCGTLGEKVGWHYGFASAGVGMAIGVVTLLSFQGVIGRAGLREGQAPIGWNNVPVIVLWCLGSIGVVFAGLFVGPIVSALPGVVKIVLALVAIGAAILLPRMIGGKTVGGDKLTAAEWKRIVAICVVTLFSVFFWMGFEQAGGSMNLFADQQTQRTLWGFEVPASWFQTINSAAILVLGPLFAFMWSWMNRSRYPLPDSAKQGLGLIVLGLSFVLMDRAKVLADATGPVSPMWLFYAYLIQTVGELMLSPVGLALTSRAAPARVAALLMGVWMLSNAAGNYLAGTLGKIMAGTGIAPYKFLYLAAIGAGVLLLVVTPILHKMLKSRDESTVI